MVVPPAAPSLNDEGVGCALSGSLTLASQVITSRGDASLLSLSLGGAAGFGGGQQRCTPCQLPRQCLYTHEPPPLAPAQGGTPAPASAVELLADQEAVAPC
jgi:hypothetical protein